MGNIYLRGIFVLMWIGLAVSMVAVPTIIGWLGWHLIKAVLLYVGVN